MEEGEGGGGVTVIVNNSACLAFLILESQDASIGHSVPVLWIVTIDTVFVAGHMGFFDGAFHN